MGPALKDGKGNSLHVMTGKVESGVLFLMFEKDPTIYAGDPSLLAILDVDPFQFANKLAVIVRVDRIDRLAIGLGHGAPRAGDPSQDRRAPRTAPRGWWTASRST